MEIKSEYYNSIDETLQKYNIPEEAREDVEESMQHVEDLILYFTLSTLSN